MDVYIARQPIFELNNCVYGYELLFRNNRTSNLYTGVDGDESTAVVLSNSFFDIHTKSLLSGKKAFINFTANLLKRGVPKLLPTDSVVVEILEDVMIDEELVARVSELKELGYTIALDDFSFQERFIKLFNMGDMIKIDFRMPRQTIEETTYMCRYAGKVMLAEKVETLEEVEYAISLGCTYMQGYYFAKPTIMVQKTINPMTRTFMQLMEMINRPDVEIKSVSELMSLDGAMVVRLLKLVNSAFYSMKNPISNVQQAITVVGLDSLKEWIYLIGLKNTNTGGNEELLKLALMRAKFCQEIVLHLNGGEKIHHELHLMGLISLMHVFFNTSLRELLAELPVAQRIKDGIMGTGGVYSEIYKLCYAYERGAWNMVDICTVNLGLTPDIIGDCYLSCVNYIQEFWDTFNMRER